MPRISGAWVCLRRKVCQRSGSCCAKLLVKFTYRTLSEHGHERRHALGSDTDTGGAEARMRLMCVCLRYANQSGCKQYAAHMNASDSSWDMQKGHVSACLAMLFTYTSLTMADPTQMHLFFYKTVESQQVSKNCCCVRYGRRWRLCKSCNETELPGLNETGTKGWRCH